MKTIRFRSTIASVVLALSFVAEPLGAADPPARRLLTGNWGVSIVEGATGCEWTGSIRLVEQGGRLSGRGSATPSTRAESSRRCPHLEGEVDGDIQGEVVRFGFATGQLGRAEFTGRVLVKSGEMRGTWSTRSAAGQWAAAR